MARCGDDRRPSWRPVVGVVLPPGHKGQPVPRTRIGDLPLGIGRNVQAPRPNAHAAVLPESRGATIAPPDEEAMPFPTTAARPTLAKWPPDASTNRSSP
jgi:hypothetical protein